MMEGAFVPANPRTVDEIFKDFKGRRAGLLRALTSEVEDFFRQSDPEKENLCLYGFPDEAWEVNLPAEEVPPEIPEPALGINFARDGMNRKDWLSLVAVHSDAWLLAVAFFYGARFDKTERKRLFSMINDIPTIFDVVSGRKPAKEKSAINFTGSKVQSSSGKMQQVQLKPFRATLPPKEDDDEEEEGEEEDEDETFESDEDHENTLCGICGDSYADDEFWICCDLCERWFHGKCVKITPARAEHIKQYKCPSCNKRARV